MIDKAEWKQLRKDLKKAKDDDERRTVTEAFFAGGAHPLPQAGDIVIKPRGDAESNNEFTSGGKSHTMLVESFDATEYKIHTIEGNVGDKVGGRTIDLKNAVDVSKIIILTRMGTQFFGASPTAAGGTGATDQSVMGPARQVAADFGGGLVGAFAGAITAMYLQDALLGRDADRRHAARSTPGWSRSTPTRAGSSRPTPMRRRPTGREPAGPATSPSARGSASPHRRRASRSCGRRRGRRCRP